MLYIFGEGGEINVHDLQKSQTYCTFPPPPPTPDEKLQMLYISLFIPFTQYYSSSDL